MSEKNNGTLSLSYSKFSAVLLKGLQEQQAEIERLQAEVRRINRLETQLAGLQAVRQQKAPGLGLGVLVLLLIAADFLFRRASEIFKLTGSTVYSSDECIFQTKHRPELLIR